MGLYNEGLAIGSNRWDTSTIKLALVTASYTPDVDHKGYAAFSTQELSGAISGYTSGGVALATSFSVDDTNDALYLTVTADPNWASIASGSIRYGVIYDETNDLLIRWLDFVTTRTLSSSAVTIRFTNNRVVTKQAA